MNNIVKLIVRLCFFIWLLFAILPWAYLMEYKLFSVIFQAGLIISICIFIMAITAVVISSLSKNKQITAGEEKYKFILHDLDNETAEKIFKDISNARYYCASKKIAKCNGCYGCWLKTPSLCVMHDGAEDTGKQISCSDEFIIISKNLYGGFSKSIKNVLDRSISFALPFFAVRNKEQHHQLRYSNNKKMRVYIYNSNEISAADKITLTEITKANSINMNISDYETIFINDARELKETIK